MNYYLLDTNILLRTCDRASVMYAVAVKAISQLLLGNNEIVITPQILIEFWVVATRPLDVNGLGWTPEETYHKIEELLDMFPLLKDNPQVFTNWLQLVRTYKVQGKRSTEIYIST